MIQAIGNLLDLPGSMIRDVASLRNPLDQLLSPFSDSNRMSGEQMIEAYGGGKGHDVLGALLSAGLDPMTYVGGGLAFLGGKKLYGAGKAAHAALEAEMASHAAARAAAAAARTSANPFAKAVEVVDGLNKSGATKYGQMANAEKQFRSAQERFRYNAYGWKPSMGPHWSKGKNSMAMDAKKAAARDAMTVDAVHYQFAPDYPKLGFSEIPTATADPVQSTYERAKAALLASRNNIDSLSSAFK